MVGTSQSKCVPGRGNNTGETQRQESTGGICVWLGHGGEFEDDRAAG